MWKPDRKEVKDLVVRALGIVVLAAALGVIHNAFFAEEGLPLFSRTLWVSPMEQAAALGIGTIPLKEAKALFDRRAAAFIDARPEAAYAEGHIAGAVSLPYDTFEKQYPEVADQLPLDLRLITYCDGRDLRRRRQPAVLLAQLGYIPMHLEILLFYEWMNRSCHCEER